MAILTAAKARSDSWQKQFLICWMVSSCCLLRTHVKVFGLPSLPSPCLWYLAPLCRVCNSFCLPRVIVVQIRSSSVPIMSLTRSKVAEKP